MQPRAENRLLARAVAAPSPLAALILLCAVPALARLELRIAALCLATAALAAFIPAAARWPAALLVGFAVTRGGLPALAAAVATLAALSLWPRPATILRRALVLVATVAVVALATGSVRPSIAALAAVAVLLAPFEARVPRFAPAAALLVAALPGAWAFAQAWRLRAASTADGWSAVADACARIGWRGCEERALLDGASAKRAAGDLNGALALFDRIQYPSSPTAELRHAELEVAAGRTGPAHARMQHLAELSPQVADGLSARAAIAWAHALARADQRELAVRALAGVHDPEADALRRRLARPVQRAPDEADFADALLLRTDPAPASCVHRGEVPPITLHWRVADGFEPDQAPRVFVHALGPDRTLFFDHPPGGKSAFVPGERFDDPLTTPVPMDAPAGRYALRVGIYTPDDQLRLLVRGRPSHLRYVDAGSFEVCR